MADSRKDNIIRDCISVGGISHGRKEKSGRHRLAERDKLTGRRRRFGRRRMFLKKRKSIRRHMFIRLAVIYLFAFASAVLFSYAASGKEGGKTTGISYEDNAVAAADGDSLGKTSDGKNGDGSVSLEYKGVAVSSDGTGFICYIANSVKNRYDMFVAIYTDSSYEEEIFLSQLMKPGFGIEGFESVKKLAPGSYNMVLVFTLVGDDHETIKSQVPVEYIMNVTG